MYIVSDYDCRSSVFYDVSDASFKVFALFLPCIHKSENMLRKMKYYTDELSGN